MTTVTVAETIYSVTVAGDTYTVTVADSQETVNVSIASAAADTQVNNSGSGTSLIKSSAGGVTTLKSVAGGSNVTLTDDGNGTVTISATEDDLSNNTTDNLSEGSTNQYFTDARVMTALETVSGHVVPSANVTYDLGSTTHMWRDVYVGPGSLFVNGKKVLSADTGEINITTSNDENLNISAGASGSSGDVTIFSAGSTTSINDNTVNLGPSLNTATVNVRGKLDVVGTIEAGDTDITSGQIHHDASNGDLTIKTNGTGKVIADTSNLVVGTLAGSNTQITPTGITGTLTGTASSIANHDTDALSEGSSNLYYTNARADARVNLQTGANLDLSNKSTTNLTEGSNLYYTNARADARAQLKIDALVDSAPGTLDTLNELAAALGDDANFSTTVTNSIATKLASADFNSTFDTRLGTKDTDNLSEGSSNLYYTDARFNTAFGNKSTSDLSEGTNLYYTDARFDTRLGTKDTDNLSEGSSNQYFTTARARASISASGSLAYNSSTGALTYTQGNTDTVAEGSSNLYFTNARADARVNAAIIDEDDFSSDSATKVPSQQSTKAYIATQIQTKDNSDEITEGSSNLYFTDARARAAISENSTQLSYNNSTGVLTYTQGDTDTVSEGSSNLYHTTARAISAVEGESTLALGGAVTVTGLLTANDTLKVDDGFTQTSFNPYGVGANMPTTVAGIGQDEGWAALHIRSRGEHDFGIGSQYNLVPRALMVLSAGRKDGSSDDYLNNDDTFGAVMYNPYSGYRTGTEWLTPSATIYGVATENHSANGMGTRLDFSTTENTNKAGAADLAHTNGVISFQGTTVTSSGTLKIDDDLQVTGDIGNNGSAVDFDDNIKITGNVSSKTTTIGDFDSSGSPAYAMSGIQLDAGDTAWPSVVFKEYAGTDGGGLKPVNLFTNPGFETEVFGGTPASPAALGGGKRILAINGNAANGATLPGLANIRILGQTVGTQSGSNRGSELIFQTTPENSTNISATLNIKEGNVIRIGNDSYDSGHGIIGASGGDLKLGDRLDTNGNNIINSSGDVTIDDNLKVNTNLTVDGNTVLGNDTSIDTVTVNAKLTTNAGLVLTSMDTATANYLAGLGAIDEGSIIYCTDGDSGSKALAVYDGSNWKRVSLGANISSS